LSINDPRETFILYQTIELRHLIVVVPANMRPQSCC
jgi:hypothetical protein